MAFLQAIPKREKKNINPATQIFAVEKKWDAKQ